MSLANVLYEWYKKNPSKVFLEGDRTLTYQQVVDEIRKTASLISPGETVAYIMFNSTRSVINYLSIYWAGGKVVAIDPLTSAEDLKFILEDSQPSLVLTDNEVLEREKNILKEYKTIVDSTGTYEQTSPYEYREDEVGLIYYYAGIAGRTMQVLHSAERVELNSASIYNAIKLKEISSILTVPLAHVLGNSVLGVTLEAGGFMYVMKKFDPKETISAIDKYSINYLATVPMVYDALANENGSLNSLRLCISTAAPLFPSTIKAFKERFNKDIVQQYGFTEGLVVTYQPQEFSQVISIGKPLPNAEVKIMKDDKIEANIGETGELWVKAPWLMLGYKDEEETRRVFEGEWLKTGDLVSADNNGLLYFKGIKKRMLKYKGYPIFPRDLEEILLSHPLVKEAFVYGEDSGNLGTQPVAKVLVKEKKEGLEDELLNYVNQRVAFYKRLKKVYIVDKIE
ncbi:class I adenylate-forming enzyme family protein [Acidianus sp. HS-5]|uniref:class I adenylate-forming enzyme family protein n=1 Tax=Acidianus sp. HS-5 TaxID=2886040 RepID=UPI001F1B64EC|nr:class I adenylate-forming enzyme family protein [Acidianus sp. HS-5]BDC19781.1 AMP-dependent synthetase [Acidianus sp. HS-5]